jgi:hypothetical protein
MFPETILHRLELFDAIHALGFLVAVYETGKGGLEVFTAGALGHPAEALRSRGGFGLRIVDRGSGCDCGRDRSGGRAGKGREDVSISTCEGHHRSSRDIGLSKKNVTHGTIPVNLPRLLIISALPSSLFLLLGLLGFILDQPRNLGSLSPIPSSDVVTLGVHLGGPDVVRFGRSRVVVDGGLWGCAVLRGDYTMCA